MKEDTKQEKNEKADDRSDDSRSSLRISGSTMRSPAKSFTDLEVWQKAHAFVLEVYRITRMFPQEERFGLVSQFRRAAVSIPANIAEGFRRYGVADKARFLNIAEGSLEECRYYCILIQDLEYGNTKRIQDALDVLAAQLATYIRRLRNK
jgi:four helix bundle protein